MTLLLEVTGGSRFKRRMIEDVCNFAYPILLPKRRKPVYIEINLVDVEEGFEAFCHNQDDDDFMIEMSRKIKGDDLITAILHELVHVKQGIKKELTEKKGIQYWKGVSQDGVEYFDQPWEIEAYAMQEELLNKYNKTVPKIKRILRNFL